MQPRRKRVLWAMGLILSLGCGVQAEESEGAAAPVAPCHRGGPGCGGPESSFPGGAFWVQDMPAAWAPAASVGCAQESDCPRGLACPAGACQPCTAHDQCESDVCDLYAATSFGPGGCLRQEHVVYVDAAARPACETGDGTRANPVCEISGAIPLVLAGRFAIRVSPGSYRPFAATDRTLFIYGPGDGSAVVGEEDISAGVRLLRSRVVLDGVDIGVHVLTGVRAEDSDVQVRRAAVHGDSQGIATMGSGLFLDRVRAAGLTGHGLHIAGAGSYDVRNSYFTGGDLPAVFLEGGAGRFRFNSVLGGGEIRPGGIDCGATARVIQDSIVTGSFAAPDGAQTVGACVHQRVVVGSGDSRADAGLIKIDPDLDAEGRLLPTEANATCCIDRGERFVSSFYRDFFGTPRPQGSSNDIGACELVPLP